MFSPRFDGITVNCPPRSFLLGLPPIGIGTPLVEGLVSYLTRLAFAHGMGPDAFLTNLSELPRTLENPVTVQIELAMKGAKLMSSSASLNSTMLLPLLQAGTGREDVACTTLASISPRIYAVGTRLHRAWCRFCFDEWQTAGTEIYEPLIWGLNAIKRCPVHLQRLESACHHCGADKQSIRPRTNAIGNCLGCKKWLGQKIGVQAPFRLSPFETWQEAEIGSLVARTSGRHPCPVPLQMGKKIASAIQTWNIRALELAQRMGVTRSSCSIWQNNKGSPSLDALCRFSFVTRMPLNSILFEENPQFDPSKPLRLLEKKPIIGPIPEKEARKMKFHCELQEKIAAEDASESLAEIAKRLGIPLYVAWVWRGGLRREFVAMRARKIKELSTSRRKEEFLAVERTVERLRSLGEPIRWQRVADELASLKVYWGPKLKAHFRHCRDGTPLGRPA